MSYTPTRQETTQKLEKSLTSQWFLDHMKVMLHRMETYLIYLNSTHYRLSDGVKYDTTQAIILLKVKH